MPDDQIILRIGADVGALVAGMSEVSSTTTSTAKDVTVAFSSAEKSSEALTVAIDKLSAAMVLHKAAATGAAGAVGGLERATATASGRILGMEAGLGAAGGALGRVAAFLPGLGEAFAIALPVALIGAAAEKISQFRDEVEKASEKAADFAIASYQTADSVSLENVKLQGQIQILEGVPKSTGLSEALLEAKISAENLGKTLEGDVQKAVDLLNVGSFSQFFTKASGNEEQFKDKLQEIINKVQEARLKLAQAPSGSDAAKDAINDQIAGYKAFGAQIDLDILQLQAMTGNHTESIAKLKDLQIGAQEAAAALGSVQEHSRLSADAGGLEDHNAAIKEQVDLQKQVIETQANLNALRAEGAGAQAESKVKLAGGGPAEMAEAEINTENQIYAAKRVGLERTADLYASAGLRYKEQSAQTAKAIEELEQEHQNKLQAIRNKSTEELSAGADKGFAENDEAQERDATERAQRAAEAYVFAYKGTLTAGMESTAQAIKQIQDSADVQKLAVSKDPFKSQGGKAAAEQTIEAEAYNKTADAIRAEQAAIVTLSAALATSDLPYEKQLELTQELEVARKKLADDTIANDQRMRISNQEATDAIRQQWAKAMMSAEQSFQTNFDQVIRGTETVKFAFIKMGGDLVLAMAHRFEQLAANQIAHELQSAAVHTMTTQTQVATTASGAAQEESIESAATLKSVAKAAAVAASHAFAAVMKVVPFPADVVLAPLAAAAAFTATLAFGKFEQGGLTSGEMIAHLHPNEMVLPAHIAMPLQNAIPSLEGLHTQLQAGNPAGGGSSAGSAAGSGGSASRSSQTNIAIHALDAKSLRDMLHNNRREFVGAVKGAIRNNARF